MKIDWRASLSLCVAAAAWLATLAPAAGQERPRTSSAVQAKAQGGGGVEPVAGAPPAVAAPTDAKPARATATAARGPHVAAQRLKAVSVEGDEVTLEIDGVREVVRPGTLLGGDTVRSVAPGRVVLDRPAAPDAGEGPAVVILTFDAAGNGKTRVFWTRDPARSPEPKRP